MTVVDSTGSGGQSAPSQVSILVLVDDGRRLGRGNRSHVELVMFQSLFLWMTVVDNMVQLRSNADGTVSILVLVDDGRRLRPLRRM